MSALSLSGYEYVDTASVLLDAVGGVSTSFSYTFPNISSKYIDIAVLKIASIYQITAGTTFDNPAYLYSSITKMNRPLISIRPIIAGAANSFYDYFPSSIFEIEKILSGTQFNFNLRQADGDITQTFQGSIVLQFEFYKKKNVPNVIG